MRLNSATARKKNLPFHQSRKIDSAEILKQIPHNPDVEDVVYSPGAVVWRIDRDKIRQGQALKIIGTDIHKHLTVRNANTVRKIHALMVAANKT